MIEGSNRLPVLLDTIKSANVVFGQAQRTTADAAFVMGKSLVEAKELCPHGEWTDFLRSTGLPKRTAQRYMRLALSGLTSEYVGIIGVTEALREIDDAQEIVPPEGRAIFAVWEDEPTPDTMIWWRISKHHGGMVQVYTDRADADSAKFLIIHSMPIVYIAFCLDVFDRGLMQESPRLQRFRREITLEERDRKIAFLKEESLRFAEARA